MKKLTIEKRNKIAKNIYSGYHHHRPLERLSQILQGGEINFRDTYNKEVDWSDNEDVNFVVGCADLLAEDAELTQAELRILIKLVAIWK